MNLPLGELEEQKDGPSPTHSPKSKAENAHMMAQVPLTPPDIPQPT